MQVRTDDLGVLDREAVVRQVVDRPLGVLIAVVGGDCFLGDGRRRDVRGQRGHGFPSRWLPVMARMPRTPTSRARGDTGRLPGVERRPVGTTNPPWHLL